MLNCSDTATNPSQCINVFKAAVYAHAAHAAVKQLRDYTGEPYIVHPEEVVKILIEHGVLDSVTLQSAWLHDVVEDTEVESNDIESMFEQLVFELVMSVTEDEYPDDMPRSQRKVYERERWRAGTVRTKNLKCADLLSNGKSIIEHNPNFARVYIEEVWLAIPALKGAVPSLLKALDDMVTDYRKRIIADKYQATYYSTGLVDDSGAVWMGAKSDTTLTKLHILKPYGLSRSQFGDLIKPNVVITIRSGKQLYLDGVLQSGMIVEYM